MIQFPLYSTILFGAEKASFFNNFWIYLVCLPIPGPSEWPEPKAREFHFFGPWHQMPQAQGARNAGMMDDG